VIVGKLIVTDDTDVERMLAETDPISLLQRRRNP
jgi:hypothetical protein